MVIPDRNFSNSYIPPWGVVVLHIGVRRSTVCCHGDALKTCGEIVYITRYLGNV